MSFSNTSLVQNHMGLHYVQIASYKGDVCDLHFKLTTNPHIILCMICDIFSKKVSTSLALIKKQGLTGYCFKHTDSPFWLSTVRTPTNTRGNLRLSSAHLLMKCQVSLQACGKSVMRRSGKISLHCSILEIFHL